MRRVVPFRGLEQDEFKVAARAASAGSRKDSLPPYHIRCFVCPNNSSFLLLLLLKNEGRDQSLLSADLLSTILPLKKKWLKNTM